MESNIPTVILSYETKNMKCISMSGKHMVLKHYLTDVGWLSQHEISRRTGVNKNTISTRMGTLPPGDKSLLQLKRRVPIPYATKEWRSLGNLPRDKNLRKMKVGTWERKCKK